MKVTILGFKRVGKRVKAEVLLTPPWWRFWECERLVEVASGEAPCCAGSWVTKDGTQLSKYQRWQIHDAALYWHAVEED